LEKSISLLIQNKLWQTPAQLVGGKELFSLSGAVECETYCGVRITGQWTILSVIRIFAEITVT